ncbi:sodium-coupled monocarboxylate transporter 1-like isoform X1 [Camponotus floridanus]|uniref:sodium-coupled monocarboxylate transporter 1-like isoform X1 n=1 Tax=Camponotus floridanus TaxID=104421 RepID=UPI000DC66CA4|nr:sodium-coupled monocarboxylate transporter 1-like isoform X1 [Camponotus floridanus]XP_019882566.2 sodium-coupled monocarboxylate transporter 1-like isoform X1 [Camponotus floridanus]XP_019882569.2 sodium-coupled monocarboxylate transporter 1-like isoform X1 [Camponotus floridanus]XP_019882570.2 sodium-coupled monocarboxylate transporter 1-like isoform X1 [Camponotus floridanus]XP_019882571.2 sodium-coupled monocarboxylate transporter 1-like isoform X1 [Camponotus floridanus]XP_019882572.2 
MTSEGTSDDLSLANSAPEVPTVQEISESMQNFGTLDYIMFAIMLVACGIVGIYFGFIKKSSGEDEYLVGGRNMKTFPVSLSLIASFISGISLLGAPTEVYVHGTSFLFITCAVIIVGFVMSIVFLPVFHDLKLTSTYEYLEKRFDKRVRLIGSLLFIIGTMTWLPIVIYVPALAFNQVTGVNVHIITPFVCIVCIFYTCVGGLKAVVWTDFIQTFIMFGSMLLIVVKGTVDIGGVSLVVRRNLESGRIELPKTDWSPLERHTIWALTIGGFVHWLQIAGVNQNMIQRYLSLPTVQSARRALWCFTVGVVTLIGICGYAGLLIYAWYYKCDPLTTKLAPAKDQLLPLLVMNVLREFPGLSGVFVAGVFSAALSSLSTGLNSMSAVVLEDFVKSFIKTPFTRKTADRFMKFTVVVLGTICVALVFVVEQAGLHVLQLSMSLDAITNGPSLGIFIMGMLLPRVNGKGALIGGLAGLSFMVWLIFSAETAIASGQIKFDVKPVSTEGCNYSFPQVENLLLSVSPDSILDDANGEEPWALYRLSYLWYTMTGTLMTITVGLIVTLITSQNVEKLDPMLLAPFMRKYLKTLSKDVPSEEFQIKIVKSEKDEKTASLSTKMINY